MKGPIVIAMCAAVSFACTCDKLDAAPLAGAADVRSSLARDTAAYPHAELILGVVDRDSTAVYSANGSAARAPDERTIFQIGSITKTFTATLLALMVENGQVALDDPIAKYLPRGVTAPSYAGKAITLETLAEQTSGLPRLPPNLAPRDMANPYANYTPKQLFAAVSQTKLSYAPGTHYQYSNFGVTLLGELLADRARATYAHLLTRRILRPLGMRDTVVVGTQASRRRLATSRHPAERSAPLWRAPNGLASSWATRCALASFG